MKTALLILRNNHWKSRWMHDRKAQYFRGVDERYMHEDRPTERSTDASAVRDEPTNQARTKVFPGALCILTTCWALTRSITRMRHHLLLQGRTIKLRVTGWKGVLGRIRRHLLVRRRTADRNWNLLGLVLRLTGFRRTWRHLAVLRLLCFLFFLEGKPIGVAVHCTWLLAVADGIFLDSETQSEPKCHYVKRSVEEDYAWFFEAPFR